MVRAASADSARRSSLRLPGHMLQIQVSPVAKAVQSLLFLRFHIFIQYKAKPCIENARWNQPIIVRLIQRLVGLYSCVQTDQTPHLVYDKSHIRATASHNRRSNPRPWCTTSTLHRLSRLLCVCFVLCIICVQFGVPRASYTVRAFVAGCGAYQGAHSARGNIQPT